MEYRFPADFLFGVSNASSQVEDQLDDTWMEHARQGSVRCFAVPHAEERLRFWSNPEVELDLAQELGVQVFRLSFDWHRLMPKQDEWDESAALHYRHILQQVKARGMKVMATIFHHGVPVWFAKLGGWTNPQSVKDFEYYSEHALKAFGNLVDFWITLNEPVPWSFLSYCQGVFPPGKKGTFLAHLKSLSHMGEAHNRFYQFAHQHHPNINIGIAHNMAHYVGRGLHNRILSSVTDYFAHWFFLKKIHHSMDYFGINYYGSEWMTLRGPAQYDDLEYSEAGRAVHPLGLLQLLRKIHRKFPQLPIYVTENGVADTHDWLRPAYLVEHLAALHRGIAEGLPIKGYVHWTLTDNFEWSDGYGPKFGLVAVDRHADLKRLKRPSFELYQRIIKQAGFQKTERDATWQAYRSHDGRPRPYWRSPNNVSGLDDPRERKMTYHEWRLED